MRVAHGESIWKKAEYNGDGSFRWGNLCIVSRALLFLASINCILCRNLMDFAIDKNP